MGESVVRINGASSSALLVSMPAPASPADRQSFDYTNLDVETSQFVQQQTGEIRALMRLSFESIVQIGQKLKTVKERLGHGHFRTWLSAEFNWGAWTANKFMQVAERFEGTNYSHLDIAPSALYDLAAPSTPQAARDEVLDRARAGESITHTAAKAIKQKYATPAKPKEEAISQLLPSLSTPTSFPTLEPPSKQEEAIKQKYATPTEPRKEAISQSSTSLPTPTSLPTLEPRSKLEIVAFRPQARVTVLPEAARVILPQAAVAPSAARLDKTEVKPDVPGVWWQLGGKHLLYCGDPNSEEFLQRITGEVQLLLAFPATPDWSTAIRATTRIISSKYLPPGKNLDQLDEFLESSVMFNSNIKDTVVNCFLPVPDIVSVISRLDRRGIFAEPDSRRVNAVVTDWRKAGIKVERVN